MIDARFNPFSKATPSVVIADDRPCVRCSYNLKGLRTGDRCPECATPIRLPSMRFDDVMSEAPMAYLRRTAGWSWGMLISGIAMTMLVIVGLLPTLAGMVTTVCSLLGAACAGVWACGAWIVTSPRQPGRPTRVDTAKEWAGLRRAARWTQVGWALGMLLASLGVGTFLAAAGGLSAAGAMSSGAGFPPVSVAFFIAGGLSMLVGFVGLIPLAIYLSLLADWAQDAGLGMRLRVAPFALAIAVPLLVLTVWMAPLMLGRWIPVFVAPLLAILGFGFLVCLGFFVVPLFQFATLCSWAVNNSTKASDRDRGLSAKLVRRIEDARAKDAPVTPVKYHKPARAQGKVIPASEAPETYDLAPEPRREPETGPGENRPYDSR